MSSFKRNFLKDFTESCAERQRYIREFEYVLTADTQAAVGNSDISWRKDDFRTVKTVMESSEEVDPRLAGTMTGINAGGFNNDGYEVVTVSA